MAEMESYLVQAYPLYAVIDYHDRDFDTCYLAAVIGWLKAGPDERTGLPVVVTEGIEVDLWPSQSRVVDHKHGERVVGLSSSYKRAHKMLADRKEEVERAKRLLELDRRRA